MIPGELKVNIEADTYFRDEKDVYDIKDTLTEEEFEKFKDFLVAISISEEQYFTLEIDGSPSLVRFGLISHRKTDDGVRIKGPIVSSFFDEKQEEKDYGDNFSVNIEDRTLINELRFERLTAKLIEKGYLTEDEAGEIVKFPSENFVRKAIEYRTF